MSGNHNQSLDRALAMVDAAAQAGAHGLKIQTYTADTMTLDLAEGEPPKYYEVLLGKRVNREVKRGTAVAWEYVG